MEEVKQLRTKQINDFISRFSDLRVVDVDDIKEGLREMLGEAPGVDFEYDVDITLNEGTGDEDRETGLKNIHVYYSYVDDTNIPKIGKLSYVVG